MALDSTIWDRIAAGDHDAYSEAFRYYFPRFYNYGAKFTSDIVLVEDAAQEALLLVWDRRSTLGSIKYVNTYFFNSFRNILVTKLRSKTTNTSVQEINEPEFSIEEMIIEKEIDSALKQRLQKAIEGLTSRQREAIFLRYYEAMPYDEVAAVLEITTKATYKIVARALEQLRELMPVVMLMLLQQGR